MIFREFSKNFVHTTEEKIILTILKTYYFVLSSCNDMKQITKIVHKHAYNFNSFTSLIGIVNPFNILLSSLNHLYFLSAAFLHSI